MFSNNLTKLLLLIPYEMNIWNTFSIYYHSLIEALHIALVSYFGLDICLLDRNQLIIWFASVLPSKMGQAGERKQKSLDFLNKKTYILPVCYLTYSAKQMLFQLPIYHQNKGEKVCFHSTISLCYYLCYLYLLCVFYSCLVRF